MTTAQRVPVLLAILLLMAAAPASAGNVGAALRLVPADSEMVLAADVDRLRSSKLFNVGVAAVEKRGGQAYADLMRQAGFDLRRDLKVAVISLSGKGDQDVVIILGGRFNMAKIKAAALKDKNVANTVYRGVEMLGKPDAMVAMVKGHLVAGAEPMVKKAIDASNGKRASRALMALLRKQPKNAGVTFAVPASGAFGADLKQTPNFKDLAALHGWARVQGGTLSASMGMDFANGTAAAAQKAELTTAVQSMAGAGFGGIDLAKALSVTQQGLTVSLNATLAEAQVMQLVGLLGI